MLMYIHDNTLIDRDFIGYLETNDVAHVAVSKQQLIDQVVVTDSLNDHAQTCVWHINGRDIDLNKDITDVFHTGLIFDDRLFETFQAIDRPYARIEWLAYLMYRLSLLPNVHNPIRHQNCYGAEMNLPSVYEIAKRFGFHVPRYVLSTDRAGLASIAHQGHWLSISQLYGLDHATPQPMDAAERIGCIAYHPGAQRLTTRKASRHSNCLRRCSNSYLL